MCRDASCNGPKEQWSHCNLDHGCRWIDHFLFVPVSASKQVHRAALTCDSGWVTVALLRVYLQVALWIQTEAVCRHCWFGCDKGVPHETAAILMHVLCASYNHAPVCVVIQATCIACMPFSCNLPPSFLAEWLASFPCRCGNRGLEWILK